MIRGRIAPDSLAQSGLLFSMRREASNALRRFFLLWEQPRYDDLVIPLLVELPCSSLRGSTGAVANLSLQFQPALGPLVDEAGELPIWLSFSRPAAFPGSIAAFGLDCPAAPVGLTPKMGSHESVQGCHCSFCCSIGHVLSYSPTELGYQRVAAASSFTASSSSDDRPLYQTDFLTLPNYHVETGSRNDPKMMIHPKTSRRYVMFLESCGQRRSSQELFSRRAIFKSTSRQPCQIRKVIEG